MMTIVRQPQPRLRGLSVPDETGRVGAPAPCRRHRCAREPAGCAALRGLDPHTCEIKRLYVRPEYWGRHIGALLAERAVADARAMGYRRMRLDTFPFMEEALSLYRRMGFHSIPRYNDNPAQSAVFLQLDL